MERWGEVDALSEKIGQVCHGERFDVVVNTLVMMLAMTGAQSSLSKQEFLAAVYGQLNDIYVQQEPGEDDGYSAIQ